MMRDDAPAKFVADTLGSAVSSGELAGAREFGLIREGAEQRGQAGSLEVAGDVVDVSLDQRTRTDPQEPACSGVDGNPAVR